MEHPVSTRKTIAAVVGARPQFVKLAPLHEQLQGRFRVVVVHTGQHYDYEMSRLFFDQLRLPQPDHDLGVGSGSHGKQLADMIVGIERVLFELRPAGVVVLGDTNSTLAGALAAAKQQVPVAHVEAGLRSFNRRMPEELNRVLTDHASSLLFSPTTTGMKNLAREGIHRGIHHSGDVMCDALRSCRDRLTREPLTRYEVQDGNYFVATVHRAENTDDPNNLRTILTELGQLGQLVLLPLHPRTRKRITEFGLEELLQTPSLRCIAPVGYLEMLTLVEAAACVLTDSGGLQKEAYFLQTPCVTMRTETEWPETVDAGWNCLAIPGRDAMRPAVERMLSATAPRASLQDEYGSGHAARAIAQVLSAHWDD